MSETHSTPQRRTEARHPLSASLGELSSLDAINLMAEIDREALQAVDQAGVALALLADRISAVFKGGGRVIFIGAGTSGRLAHQQASELPPTFGVSPRSFIALVASRSILGESSLSVSEDDVDQVTRQIERMDVGPHDAIIGIAASGSTPFVLAGMDAAKARGAWCCGIANNPGTPILRAAHHQVLLDTGAEALTGSTRLKAGTAQKLALDRATTAAMVQCGRVTENLMTGLIATNSKLVERALSILMETTSCDQSAARDALALADGSVHVALTLLKPFSE